MSRTPFVSEVPVRCELLRTENGGWVLERRLDPGFARLPAAREAFLEEIAAAAAQKGGASGLAVVLEASGGSEPRLAREYRPEGTLRDLLRAGPPPEETAIGIVSAIADGRKHTASIIQYDLLIVRTPCQNFYVNEIVLLIIKRLLII